MARVSNLDAASAERVLLLLLERELKIFSQQVIGQQGLEGPMVRHLPQLNRQGCCIAAVGVVILNDGFCRD